MGESVGFGVIFFRPGNSTVFQEFLEQLLLTFEWIWQSSLLFFYFDIQSSWLTCIVCHLQDPCCFCPPPSPAGGLLRRPTTTPQRRKQIEEKGRQGLFQCPSFPQNYQYPLVLNYFTWNLSGNRRLKLVLWLAHILWSHNWCLFLEAVKIGEDKKDKKEEKEVRTPARFSVPRRPHAPQRTCFQGHWAKLDAQYGFLFKSESTEITNFQFVLVGTHWQSI